MLCSLLLTAQVVLHIPTLQPSLSIPDREALTAAVVDSVREPGALDRRFIQVVFLAIGIPQVDPSGRLLSKLNQRGALVPIEPSSNAGHGLTALQNLATGDCGFALIVESFVAVDYTHAAVVFHTETLHWDRSRYLAFLERRTTGWQVLTRRILVSHMAPSRSEP